jgi:hypothetical protein
MTRFEALGILPDEKIFGFSLVEKEGVLELSQVFTPEALVDSLPPHAVFQLKQMNYLEGYPVRYQPGLFVHVTFITNKGIVGTYLEPEKAKLRKLCF